MPSPTAADLLIEVVAARTNGAGVAATGRLLATLTTAGPFALELALADGRRRFLARAADEPTADQLIGAFRAAYPQAGLHHLDAREDPLADPARVAAGERVACCALRWTAGAHLPIRTFEGRDLADEDGAQADPILTLLNAAGDLPPGWRFLAQIVLAPAPRRWARPYLRLALEPPLVADRQAHHGEGTADALRLGMPVLLLAGGVQVWTWYAERAWLPLGLLGGGLAVGAPLGIAAWHRLNDRPIVDPLLVRRKIGDPAFIAQVRCALFAPVGEDAGALADRLRRIAAVYGQYTLPAGNGFAPRPLRLPPPPQDAAALATVAPLPRGRGATTGILTVREGAGLWHIPRQDADVAFVERTSARQRLPLPAQVARGCRIGVAAHQGFKVPTSIPDDLFLRNTLLLAKTRRGKTELMLRKARHRMEQGRGVVLIDPQSGLARSALGLVPPGREGDVVYLDLAADRPFGLNLIDAGLGANRDLTVADVLQVFEQQFRHFWGPRMEDVFRFALLTLYGANEALCATSPAGRDRQYTILDINPLLTVPAFRRAALRLVDDPFVLDWWATYFDNALHRNLQLEAINPVLTKANRFAATWAARAIVGQPRSTIDPAAWLTGQQIVLIDGASGTLGEETTGLLGAALVNRVKQVLAAQLALPEERRLALSLMIDEFHMLPAADYDMLLSGLNKCGASLTLATQSLDRLDGQGDERHLGLRSTIFANLDGLFVFNCSARDAAYVIPELGERAVDIEDLTALGEHRCYVRMSSGGERLPTFLVQLDPPLPRDEAVAARLARASAARYGRSRDEIEAMLAGARARVASPDEPDGPGAAGGGWPERPPADRPPRPPRPPRGRRGQGGGRPGRDERSAPRGDKPDTAGGGADDPPPVPAP